ncbi:MAG: VIT1/CCC1 transporter family protein, partial [Bifidobacterium crudilactis]|nr:VIT1/CCC1 transporter family protein [Bifidobacterium crudilactis]
MANKIRQSVTPHPGEQHQLGGEQSKLNWLRAGVLGANDGIVSVAGTIIGVAGAGSNIRALMVAGFAALAAGAFSMAGGEYVSVSTQRDTERALLDKERWELKNCWDDEVDELAQIYETKGISPATARTAAL